MHTFMKHEHTLILKKPTRDHSLLAPLLQHTLASFCKVSLLANIDKQLLFSPPCCLSSRGQGWNVCVGGPHPAWSARVKNISKGCISDQQQKDPAWWGPSTLLRGRGAKVLLSCSADCRLQTLTGGEIFWWHCLACGSQKLSTTNKRRRQADR